MTERIQLKADHHVGLDGKPYVPFGMCDHAEDCVGCRDVVPRRPSGDRLDVVNLRQV